MNLFMEVAIMTNKKRLTISLADTIFEKLEKAAAEKGLSKSAMITFLIEGFQNNKNK